ncbi:MAG: TolC family protein [Planctomycetota bacterium]
MNALALGRSLGAALFVLFIVAIAPGCTGGGPRPVPRILRPDSDTLGRLRIDETDREPSPVTLIAVPEDSDAGSAPEDASAGGPEADPAGDGPKPDPLTFEELLRSVEEQFPLILAAIEEFEIAAGELMSAEGQFDLRLRAGGAFAPEGFYRTEEGGVSLSQPLGVGGAEVFGGYKIGTGDFPLWEGGRETNGDGEFSAGFRLPLLQGFTIDAQRLALWRARIRQAAAQPLVLERRLDTTRKAAISYWKWVAAGQKREIAQRLLDLAETREDALEIAVGAGQLPEIIITDNQRLIVERRSILVRAELEVQQAAIQLSLFWRDAEGQPRIPGDELLPAELPRPQDPALFVDPDDVELALAQRPEVRLFELRVSDIDLEIDKAKNDTLPELDVAVRGSQDYGDPASDPDDKGDFELDALVNFDVPLQRRVARGTVRSLTAERSQIQRQLQITRDRVVADVQASGAVLSQNWEGLELTRETVRLAGVMEEAERFALRQGQSDLLRVNIRERDTAAAASNLVDSLAEHFRALAEYRASLGVPYDEVGATPQR